MKIFNPHLTVFYRFAGALYRLSLRDEFHLPLLLDHRGNHFLAAFYVGPPKKEDL